MVARKQSTPMTGPIWPSPYDVFAPDVAWDFVRLLRTWNEAEQSIMPMPSKAYLETITHVWVESLLRGEPLVIEKCRRMVVSWLLRGLELWAMGVKRMDITLCGIDLPAAASHCWRYLHLYETLRQDNPGWKLRNPNVIRERGERYLESFRLANGSHAVIHNQLGGGLVGEGRSLVVLEELSRYRNPAHIWAQSKILTQGSGTQRGAVVAVTNASMNEEWKQIKS